MAYGAPPYPVDEPQPDLRKLLEGLQNAPPQPKYRDQVPSAKEFDALKAIGDLMRDLESHERKSVMRVLVALYGAGQ